MLGDMLVLSRKKNESIVINNDIIVTVVEFRPEKVRLGIVRPKDVSVHRKEVFDAVYKGKDLNVLPRVSTLSQESDLVDVVDRLAAKLSERTMSSVSREMVIDAILEAVEAIEESLSKATSLEDLKQLMLRRRH